MTLTPGSFAATLSSISLNGGSSSSVPMNAHESENMKKRENRMAMPTMNRVPRGSMPAFVRLRTVFARDGFLPDFACLGRFTWEDRVDALEGALINPVVERNEWRVDIAGRAEREKGATGRRSTAPSD